MTTSSARLLTLLTIIGWSQYDLARRAGRGRTTIQQWCEGRVRVDPAVGAWLETIAAYLTAHPAPRRAQPPPADAQPATAPTRKLRARTPHAAPAARIPAP